MVKTITTNFPGGVTDASPDETMGSYVLQDPTSTHELFDDFNSLSVGTTGTDWLATKVGTTPTTVVASEEGSSILITTSTGASDSCFLQWLGKNASAVAESFSPEAGRSCWFKTRVKTSDVILNNLVFGLQITDTTPLAVSDGLYFIKPSGAATVNFISAATSVLTTSTAIATMVNATYQTFGFYYNGVDSIKLFVNDLVVGGQGVTTLTAHTLALSFGIQNSTGVAQTMNVDYIFAAEERPYP